MTGKGHTRPRTIVRVALMVAYLALFVTQLSGRYYFCASYPCTLATQRHNPASGKSSLTPDAQTVGVLSLDKRFDGKQVYALLSPVIAIILPLPAPRKWLQEQPAGLPHILPPIPQQRGPPLRA